MSETLFRVETWHARLLFLGLLSLVVAELYLPISISEHDDDGSSIDTDKRSKISTHRLF